MTDLYIYVCVYLCKCMYVRMYDFVCSLCIFVCIVFRYVCFQLILVIWFNVLLHGRCFWNKLCSVHAALVSLSLKRDHLLLHLLCLFVFVFSWGEGPYIQFMCLKTEGVVVKQFVKPIEEKFTFDILWIQLLLCRCEALWVAPVYDKSYINKTWLDIYTNIPWCSSTAAKSETVTSTLISIRTKAESQYLTWENFKQNKGEADNHGPAFSWLIWIQCVFNICYVN